MSIADAPTIVPPDTSTDDDLMELLAPYVEDSDPHRRTHIVRPGDNHHITQGLNMTGKDVVNTARMNGQEVVALCGYKWVPQHNPADFDACEPCMKVAGWIMEGKIR